MAENPSPWGCQEETNTLRQVIITLGDELPNKHSERVHLLVTHFVLEFLYWPDFSGPTFFILLILWWMLISAPVSPPLVPKFGASGPILPTTEFQSPSNGAARIIYNLLPNNSGTKWHGGILFIPWILSPSTLKRPIPSDGSSYHSHVDSFCRYWWSTCHASRMVTDLRVNERTKTLPSPNSIVLLAGGWERSEQINRVRLDTLQRTK